MQGNGFRPGASAPGRLLALFRPATFEWSGGAARSPWLWVALGALSAIPIPMMGWPLPERAAPIFYLLVAGAACALARIARASWPFAALILWAGLRASYGHFPMRTLQLLALLLMAGFLYVAAREMPDRIARLVVWGFIGTAGFEILIGGLNAVGRYPWMSWVSPEHAGKPMGFLTHPNYWGSFIALCLPLIWSRIGWAGVLLAWALILKTVSGGPVISAALGSLVMVWPFFGRKMRLGVAAFGGAAVALTMTLHEWRLSGRTEVWQKALSELKKWPIVGQGLGEWRSWADEYNAANYAPQAGKSFFVTLQAHNEPYQLLFELGVIGVLIALLWVLQAGVSSWVIWKSAPVARIPGPWYLWGRVPLERAWVAVLVTALVNMLGSPTFHLPGQALVILFVLARAQADADALSIIRVSGRRPGTRRKKEIVHEAAV